MMSTLRSLWAWMAIGVLILVWLPLLAVIRLFDRDPAHYTTGRWFRRLGVAMAKVNPAWKVDFTDFPIPDPRNPYVVVSNHQSLADIPIISYVPWEMKWVAKAELFQIPFVGWMMQLAGDIPVERGEKASRARVLVVARSYLDRKCSVMFFPEGTRSKDGRVHRFTDGAFRLAIKTQLPVLPVVIEGTGDALPKHSWRFGEPSRVRLRVLPPVGTAGLAASDTEALRRQVRGMIVDQIASWRGVPREEVDAEAESVKDSAKTDSEAV